MRLVGCLAPLLAVAACSSSPTGPEISGGAGLRVKLEGTAGPVPLRVELWHRNEIPVEDCEPVLPEASEPRQLCSRVDLTIWNLLGQEVRTEEAVPWEGHALGWDQVDDQGREVLSGIYFTEQLCIDEDVPGSFRFLGAYHVMRDAEAAVNASSGACDWPLFVTDRTVQDELRIHPIPVDSGTLAIRGTGVVQVDFTNPYRVRISVSGEFLVEQEVILKHGYFTEIVVDAGVLSGPASS